ncbi:MAG TPA: PAS domain-containing protein, partial [Myxococcales bacterium]|nr:PAS domain-containing protein [Myxococcales bacterium]
MLARPYFAQDSPPVALSSGLWTLDLDAGTVSLDAGASALVGFSSGELSELLACFEGPSAALFQTELDQPHDLRLRTTSGKTLRSVSKPAGRLVQGLFVATGPGASREEILSAVADRVPVVLCYLDRDERYVYANREYVERYGRGAAVIGRTAKEVLPLDAYDRLHPLLQRTYAGETLSFETSVARPRSSPLWVSATYLPDYAHDGSVQGIVVLSEDITARKEAEELRARSERELLQLAELIPQICWTND